MPLTEPFRFTYEHAINGPVSVVVHDTDLLRWLYIAATSKDGEKRRHALSQLTPTLSVTDVTSILRHIRQNIMRGKLKKKAKKQWIDSFSYPIPTSKKTVKPRL